MSSFLSTTPVAVPEVDQSRWAEVLGFVTRATQACERFASSTVAVILAFSVIYFVPTLWIAAHKLFWDDEFFTLYLSAAPGWHEIVRALSTGADQHPPSFYFLTHLFIKAFGTTHVTVRLPEILAFWSMCVLMYLLVRRFLGNTWGVVAMLLPLAFSGMYYYASEARGYALLLAFSTLSLLSWTRAVEDCRRRLFLPLLACGLAGAVASHYYAVLVALALGIAELVRTFLRRRVDWPVWVAFTGTLVPLIIFFPVIRSSMGYAGHFWAHPKWHMIFDFFPQMLGYFPNVFIGTAAVALWLKSRRSRAEEDDQVPPRPVPLWIVTAVVSLSLIPCFAMLLAKAITHGYVDRYAIPGAIGGCILSIYFLYYLAGKRRIVVSVSIALAFLTYGLNVYLLAYANWVTLDDLREDRYFITHKAGDGPIVVDEVTIFHRLSFYAQPELSRRLAYIADADASVKYLGQDTIDRGLLALRPWFPINVIPVNEFVRSHPSFAAYGYVGNWTWVTYGLAKPGVDTRLRGRRGDRLLFSVLDASGLVKALSAPEGVDETRSLYSKYKDRTESLCAAYMGAQNCPAI